jgi:hypothetical protein
VNAACIAFALSLAGPAGADAVPPQRVALGGLATQGDVAPADAEAVGAAIEDTLQRGRYELLSLQAECADLECWRAAGREAEALFVVRARLRREAADQTITLELIDVRGGSVVGEASDTCDLCGRSELVDLAGDLAAKMRRQLDRLAGEPATLALSSTPRGATVTIDGEAIGTTPLRHRVAPGRHEIRLELEGHQPLLRATEVVGGTREAMAFELVPLPSAPTPAPSATDDRPLRGDRALVGSGAALLVAGLGGVGVGAALVAIHANPIEGACSGGDVDPDGDCRWLHDTRGGGIAALALGGAGAVAGAVLLGVGLRRRGKRVSASISARQMSLEVRF